MDAWPLTIHGSCVSRDLVPFLPMPVELMRYVARQSIISAMSAPWEPPARVELQSPFQARMVEQDLASDAVRLLTDVPKPPRLMLMDLIDERLGLIKLGDQQFITRSFEFLNVRTLTLPSSARVVPFGTDEHWELFQEAATRYLAFLDASGLLPRVRLLRAPFATHTVDDADIPPFMGRPSAEWDELFEPYYTFLERGGVTSASLSLKDAHSDAAHQWGPAPYHYSEPTSHALVAALMATLDSDIAPPAAEPEADPAEASQ